RWQRREEAANDSIQCDLRYQGQLEDPESGLYYNVNRYYDADSGQYLSPDPIGFAGGLRPQAYVANHWSG
uniref:RHS repeat-associated core domain-containing protein n=1 Tax=Salinivibrio socompensis TaxID=1510206 RepID=UPI001F0B47C4